MATSTTWDEVLNNPQPSAPGGVNVPSGDPAEDGVLVASSKFASKCRACQNTIDIGDSAWFQRDGEPGRKTTCVACHNLKTAAADTAPDPEKPAEKPKKTTVKRPRPQTKLEPKMLADVSKGVVAVFREFRNIKFKGKKHEATDLRKLLSKYAEWAHSLLPAVDLPTFVEKLDKVSGNGDVRMRIAQLRDVQQGLLTLDEMQEADEYARQPMDDFGEPLPVFAAGADDDDDWHVGGAAGGGALDTESLRQAARAAAAAAPAVNLTAEQVERMARNRQLALERAAALRAVERQASEAAAGGSVGGDEFPEEDEGYPAHMGDYPDDVSDCDEEMAAQMLGDIEEDEPVLARGDPPPQAPRAAAGLEAGAEAGRVGGTGGTAAAEAETQAYAGESQIGGGESPVAAVAELSASSSGARPEDEAAERRARALAEAMAIDEDF